MKSNAPRQLVWFSCGAASAACAKLCADDPNTELVYCKPGTKGLAGGEHEDNARFLRDVEDWTGKDVQILVNEKYTGPQDVWLKRQYIAGPRGAACTSELKKQMRERYQSLGDVHVFGYTLDERDRAARFRERHPDLQLRTLLIEEGLTKDDCLGLIWDAGIELPELYKLGFDHNNCFTGDTRFLTDKGTRTLQDACGENVRVLGYGANWQDAKIRSFGEQPLWEVQVARHGKTKKIHCTPDHIWFVGSNRCETVTRHLTAEDKL